MTHSFVSEARVKKLGLTEEELQFDLVVFTPAAGLVRTSLMCVRCQVEVEGASVEGEPDLFTFERIRSDSWK